MWQHYHKDYSEYSSRYISRRVKIVFKASPDFFIADWLSRQNHKDDKDKEIAGMQMNVNSVETPTNIPEL